MLTKDDPTKVPGSLIAATALAVGGALASIALLVFLAAPWATCTDYCPGFRQIAYMFLAGNAVIAALHGSLFLLMWRGRAAAAWWASVALVAAILLFDTFGEVWIVVALTNPNALNPTLGSLGSVPALIPTMMILLAGGLHLGGFWEVVASNWLVLHASLVELPILILLSRRPVRRWCRIHLMARLPGRSA